jgi:hypothetical protein
MTADALFRLCNSLALAGWLLLVVTGWSPRASRVIAAMRPLPGAHPHSLGWPPRWIWFSQWRHVALHRSLARACRMGPLSGLRPLHRKLAGTGRKAQPCAVPGGIPVPGPDFPLRPNRPAALSISGWPHLSGKSVARASSSSHLSCVGMFFNPPQS